MQQSGGFRPSPARCAGIGALRASIRTSKESPCSKNRAGRLRFGFTTRHRVGKLTTLQAGKGRPLGGAVLLAAMGGWPPNELAKNNFPKTTI